MKTLGMFQKSTELAKTDKIDVINKIHKVGELDFQPSRQELTKFAKLTVIYRSKNGNNIRNYSNQN